MVSISFENPLFLWYLLSIPLIIVTHFILLRYTRVKAMKFANFDALKRVTGNYLVTKNWTVLGIRIAILTLLILAASGSVLYYKGSSNNNNFVLAIDTSASMCSPDIPPRRLDAAKDEAMTFVENLHSSGKIGLISFAGVSIIESQPTDSKRELLTTISAMDLQPTGGTDVGGAIVTGSNLLLQEPEGDKGRVLIILSDGSNTAGSFLDKSIDYAIDYATQKRVVVHTIGFGTNTGPLGYLQTLYNITSSFDDSLLKEIANNTGGQYYAAPDKEALHDAYQAISDQSSDAILSVNLSYGLMLAALLLLFVEWGLLNTRFRRVP